MSATTVRSRRRLILGEEEEPLPDIPEPQRAPYVSPTLAQVTAPEGTSSAQLSVAAAALGSGSQTAAEAVKATQPREAAAAHESTLSTIDLSSDASPAEPSTVTANAPSPDGASSMEDIMAQVAKLEEQGMLVEASTLMARALSSVDSTTAQRRVG